MIATETHWKHYTQGKTVSNGLGGILGLLEDVAPGVAVVISPIELREMMGTQLIETGASGTKLGWDWNVLGPDEVDGEELWKVSLENNQIRDNCFGHARITMWLVKIHRGQLGRTLMSTFQEMKVINLHVEQYLKD